MKFRQDALYVMKHSHSIVVGRVLVAAMLTLVGPPALAAADEIFSQSVGPFLKQHCIGCHGPTKQESGIRLDRLDGYQPGNRTLWTMIHGQIADDEMPPADKPRPAAAGKKQLLTWIEDQQKAQAAGSTRRLNRREVSAALRQLTGLDINYAHALPGDGNVAGFDTGADGLQDAADGIAQWMRVSRRAVDGIRFLDSDAGPVFIANLREAKDAKKTLDEWKTLGITGKIQGIAKPGVGLLLDPRSAGEREALTFYVPPPANRQGVLRLTLVVSVMKPFENIPNPRLWVDVGGVEIDFREITAEFGKPLKLTYEVQIDDLAVQGKGIAVSLANKIEMPYAVEGFENDDRPNARDPVPGGIGVYRPVYDRKLPPEKQPAPFIVLQEITIEPGYVAAWPPASWNFPGSIRDDDASAGRLLQLWIDNAWRRPATPAEREPFLKLYRQLRDDKNPFDDSLRAAFQSVLMSAPFRYLVSPGQQKDAALAQYAIASRLSFMLTGGPPDAELRTLATAGRLREPTVLDAQVDRLLNDPRSLKFVRPFVMQWLEMEQPITIAMDHIQKQDFRFARYLKASMKDETVLYVAQMLADNRPARELLSSDWTMMNDSLARHYGYTGFSDGTLRQVKLRPDDAVRGGGIIGHAGIQSMLCWMGDNWLIYRGAWALRHIVDHPPPPPPLEIPELNPADGQNKGKTFRELLKQHQEDKNCAVCHKHIDPIGFAFQNFDISGRWRDQEFETYAKGELDGKIAWKGTGTPRPVDAVGKLPRGEQFKNFAEFKQMLVKEYQPDVVRGLLKNLMVYATGRTPDVAGMKEIADIMNELKPKEYPMRDLIKGIVRSRAFLETP